MAYITAKEYMKRYKLSGEQFSDYLNNFMLNHKYQEGQLMVRDNPPPVQNDDDLSLEDLLVSKDLDHLPPPPSAKPESSKEKPSLSTDLITMSQVTVFKEENKEILKFSEKSLTTMANYTQTIFRDKERIIEMKDKKIDELEKELSDKDDIIRLLKQQAEDYHMLTSLVTNK